MVGKHFRRKKNTQINKQFLSITFLSSPPPLPSINSAQLFYAKTPSKITKQILFFFLAVLHLIRMLLYMKPGSPFKTFQNKVHIKLEGVKLRFPLTWFKCTMARSYAVWTDLRTLGFFPSMRRSLSTVSSIPSGSSLLRGSHCLGSRKKTYERPPFLIHHD